MTAEKGDVDGICTKGAVVLLSGGLDSATVLGLAKAEEIEPIHTITFDYGQLHKKEVESACAIAAHFGVSEHRVFKIDLASFGGSALTDGGIDIPENRDLESIGADIPATYVPGRNMVFLALCSSFAEAKGLGEVYIGANSLDFSGYPDCRPAFFDAFQKALDAGTKAGADGNGIRIKTPLLDMTKAEIIRKGLELGVPYELTWSCYAGGEKPCGNCDACVLREKGFAEAGTDDPLMHERETIGRHDSGEKP